MARPFSEERKAKGRLSLHNPLSTPVGLEDAFVLMSCGLRRSEAFGCGLDFRLHLTKSLRAARRELPRLDNHSATDHIATDPTIKLNLLLCLDILEVLMQSDTFFLLYGP